ncbi:hypothetical protein DVH05_000293 [Phytophthora capsici]|nr:hypothetical protein DVH05_000293 [Phytophthora capsici]
MEAVRRFAFLKTSVGGTASFVYGATDAAALGEQVSVDRVTSGRWADLEPYKADVPGEEFEAREVSEGEAISGIGTYVGSYVCVARTPPMSARVWDYGAVVGYSWCDRSSTGQLSVIFGKETLEIPYDEGAFEVLDVEAYALRPCFHLAVSHVMPREMRAMHVSVTNHFNGRGRNATRNSKVILRGVAQEALDERQRVPLFDVSTARVVYVSINYILNFTYYSGSRRRTPQNVAIGNSIFDEEVQSGEPVANGVVGTPPVVNIERGNQGEIQQLATDTVAPDSRPASANTPLIDNTGVLSESEEDSDEVSPIMERSGSVGVLRRRPASEALCPNISRLQRLRTSFAGDPDMQRELDQFILFRETGLAGGSASSLHTQGQASISAGEEAFNSGQQRYSRRFTAS